MTTPRELGHLREQLAERITAYPARYWSPAFLVALSAMFDMQTAQDGSDAVVLTLVKR